MNRILLPLFLFFSFLSVESYAQHNLNENKIWAFGSGCGIDFTSGTPVPIRTKMQTREACATISDVNGNLLFYTSGDTVYDRNGSVMPNGAGIIGQRSAMSAHQGTQIVPVLDSSNQYYVFSQERVFETSHNNSNPMAGRLFYTIVDMDLNGGLGEVLPDKRGIIIDSVLSEMIVSIPGVGCDMWLIAHSIDPLTINAFKVYNITRFGINPVPVVSNTGRLYGHLAYALGYIAVAPNQRKIAITSSLGYAFPFGWGVEVFDFDPATGVVSNAMTIDSTTQMINATFSSDNSKLYTTLSLTQEVVQYDLSLPTVVDIANSRTTITPEKAAVAIQLGPDDKIYMTQDDSTGTWVHFIEYPNLAGPACNFVPKAFKLLGASIENTLPNTYFKPVAALVEDTLRTRTDARLCPYINDELTLEAPPAFYNYKWNDGSTNPSHTFKEAGTYWVSYKGYCSYYVDTFVVRMVEMPYGLLGQDTIVCNDRPFKLSVSYPGLDYLWSDNSTDSTYIVKTTGTYWLTFTKEGCERADTISVTLMNLKQNLGEDFTYCQDQQETIKLEANVRAGASVRWNTGATSPSIKISEPGLYTVTVSYPPCSDSDDVYIAEEVCNCKVAIPSAFSPNGDGRNDAFQLVMEPECPVSGYQINIYDRWGRLIFTSQDAAEKWDGSLDGVPLEVGSYMYFVQFESGTAREKHTEKGDITLVR